MMTKMTTWFAMIAAATMAVVGAMDCDCQCGQNATTTTTLVPTPTPAPARVADGNHLKKFLHCYAPWIDNIITDPNSYLDGCKPKEVMYCRTTTAQDVFCKFDGTNTLVYSAERPSCWYSCGMMTCDSWTEPHTSRQKTCVKHLLASVIGTDHKEGRTLLRSV
jgi:hypothetical protein